MKLIRFGESGKEKPGVIVDDRYYDVSGIVNDYDEAFFAHSGLEQLRTAVQTAELPEVRKNVRLGSPVARPSKIVCVGLNYSDHALEIGLPAPTEPILFLKSTTSLCGPDDAVMVPRGAEKTDWEVELAVVMEKKASYVTEDTAMEYVAGYCILNDVSERAYQMERNGTWDKGKGCDTFAPTGPWLVTKDEIYNVDALRLWLSVNNTMMQDGTTANLIFKIPFLISYISQFMTLLPGDIISTGTPAGVGMGMKPAVFLKKGDVMKLGIDGLGEAEQKVI